MDNESPQAVAFIPSAPAGSLPAQWDGTNGLVADAIVDVSTNWTATPGAHTLKVSLQGSTPYAITDPLRNENVLVMDGRACCCSSEGRHR